MRCSNATLSHFDSESRPHVCRNIGQPKTALARGMTTSIPAARRQLAVFERRSPRVLLERSMEV